MALLLITDGVSLSMTFVFGYEATMAETWSRQICSGTNNWGYAKRLKGKLIQKAFRRIGNSILTHTYSDY